MLAALHGPGALVDIGAGPGHLRRWLQPERISRYIAVDRFPPPAEAADGPVPAERIQASVETWQPPAIAIGALTACEVLDLVDAPGKVIERLAGQFASVGCVIVSMVAAPDGKPNWRRAAARVWDGLEATRWPVIDRVRVESRAAGLAWEIAAFRPHR